MFRCGVITLALCLATVTAQAALLGRAPATTNGTDYQAYYDDALNITWLADANYAKTSGYDADGLMPWSASLAWIASLNSSDYLGVNNWRLPIITDTGVPGCGTATVGVSYSGTDCGWNVDLATGEMARMFYGTLGNTSTYNTSGVRTGCGNEFPPCLTNVGTFSNLQPRVYWYGTEYHVFFDFAWAFDFDDGLQADSYRDSERYSWAVTDGDAFAAVPVPGAVWLFGSALGLMGVMRRKINGLL